MTDLTLESLAQRLERVERQNRRLRVGATAVALMLAVMTVATAVLCGRLASPNRTVHARGFVLRDEHGNTRAALFLPDSHAVALALRDVNGRARALLRILGRGRPRLDLLDADGYERATLAADTDGPPSLTLYGPTRQPRLRLGTDMSEIPPGAPADYKSPPWLRMWDAQGNTLFSAP